MQYVAVWPGELFLLLPVRVTSLAGRFPWIVSLTLFHMLLIAGRQYSFWIVYKTLWDGCQSQELCEEIEFLVIISTQKNGRRKLDIVHIYFLIVLYSKYLWWGPRICLFVATFPLNYYRSTRHCMLHSDNFTVINFILLWNQLHHLV